MTQRKRILAVTAALLLVGTVATALFIGCACEAPNRVHMLQSEDAYARAAYAPLPAATEELPQGHNTETYDHIEENTFRRVAEHPLSTFSIDVDTASYANMRRFLNNGQLPPAGAVRIEELVNYFDYAYAPPPTDSEHPFAAHAEVASCPWAPKHRLVKIGLRGKDVSFEQRPPCNLVFLLDVSGSMKNRNKLPLVKKAMKMLVEKLNSRDRIAICVYAGAAGRVLDSTTCDDRKEVLSALDRLEAGGSTNGAAGIDLAYQTARENYITGGINRVILCTDGDFNVGNTSRSGLVGLVRKQTRNGVYLTVLGFGMGNYKDAMMEEISNRGNGNYAYVDSEREARKVLVEQINSTLVTIAKDVKIQIEFNPAEVAAYRLIGYENRLLNDEDFNDDTKDAGEIGAGHTVTALYEVVPAGGEIPAPQVDELRYQQQPTVTPAADSGEMLTLKLRYKQPDGETSTLMTQRVVDAGTAINAASEDLRFAAAVACFGMLLRDSDYAGNYTLDAVEELAEASRGKDTGGYRKEFVELIQTARKVASKGGLAARE
jgi:Ca-activated chloride channel family protein